MLRRSAASHLARLVTLCSLVACHTQAPAKAQGSSSPASSSSAVAAEPVASPPTEAESAPTAAQEASATPSAAPAPEPSPAEPAPSSEDSGGSGRLSTVDRFEHAPVVRMRDISLRSGDADPQLVKHVVRTMLGAERLCYERALRKKADMQGSLTLRLNINPEGTPFKIEKLASTLSDKDFESCAQNAFTHLTLGTGHDLVVEVPLLFAP